MPLAFDDESVKNCQTKELRQLLETIKNTQEEEHLENDDAIIKILERAYKLIGKSILPTQDGDLRKPLDELLTMEPWLRDLVLLPEQDL